MTFNLKNSDKFQRIKTIDAHTEGEPLRLITEGYPPIPGDSILAKRQYLVANLDQYRQYLMYEPRGHADMYGAILTEPTTEDGDFGILFMHNEGYSSMCGHGILAAVTIAMECGQINPAVDESLAVRIDSPAGRITAYAKWRDGRPDVSFDCVASFVEATDQHVSVAGLGMVNYDVAFGGAYYAYVDADKLGLDCSCHNTAKLIEAGRAIKQAVAKSYTLVHPLQQDLSFLYGTIFTSRKGLLPGSHSRHVCIFADGEVDRSPTGTGVSGRIALLYQRGEVGIEQTVRIESLISSYMDVCAIDSVQFYNKASVIPRVTGRAFITGQHEFLVDRDDPLAQGFLLR